MEKNLGRSIHMKTEAKQKKQKLGFLGWFMCTHEQPRMQIIKPVYAALMMRTLVSAQKP